MPDPKQMSGIPRQVDDLPNGTVSVRLIRGQLSNNIVGHPVELQGGAKPLTVKTDDGGRAQFSGIPAGTSVKAVADVDGEHLESQEFPFPGQGGIRLLLVATDKAAATRPAVTGTVSIGTQSRIIIQPGDETVTVYYLLSIQNAGSAPVNTAAPFAFEMPSGAVGTSVLQGSSPQVTVSGAHVQVQGPFAPGPTFVQVACELPSTRGTLEIAQRFPAQMEQLAVVVKKLGNTQLSSPMIANQQNITADGETYIAASGGPVPADQTIRLVLGELPHHSGMPRAVALGLVVTIVIAGVWASSRKAKIEPTRALERKRLTARREALLGDLVRLEHDHRSGRIDDVRYSARREQLVSALELVYGALDDDASPPDETIGDLRRGAPARVKREGGASANA
jgi:hypothetical protein